MAAQALAANGARVYAAGRRLEVLEKSAKVHANDHPDVSGEIIPIEMDQNDKDSITRAFEHIKSREKKIDLLVNNAGLASNKASARMYHCGEPGLSDLDLLARSTSLQATRA
jgi:NADP-dependent 3-hydroxy acid dehydrogenase YdfG